jgi:hypothetical protein
MLGSYRPQLLIPRALARPLLNTLDSSKYRANDEEEEHLLLVAELARR